MCQAMHLQLASAAVCTRYAMPAGDTKGIDDVIERVQLIVEPVETVMFDLFDQAHAPQWRALRARFFADNEEVKAATRELIDTSFRKLRSAEGAFELFQVCVGNSVAAMLNQQRTACLSIADWLGKLLLYAAQR